MNKIKTSITYAVFLSLVGLSTLAFTQHVYAESDTSTATTSPRARKEIQDKRQEFKSSIQEKREDFRDQAKDKREEFKSNLEAEKEKFKSERMRVVNNAVGNSVDKMVERLNAVVARLSSIADKVMTRSAKVKALGKDTTQVDKHVADARAQIELAKANILKIPAAVNTGIASTTPRNRFEGLRTLAETIRTQLKSAHSSLGSALKLLKTLDPKPNATSTSNRSDN